MDKEEPPLSRNTNTSNNHTSRDGQTNAPQARTPLFLVGKDSRGHWVVRDQSGRCGGLFKDRAEALKFAMFENGHRPQAVIMVPGVLELDLSAPPRASRHSAAEALTPVRRVA